MAGRISIFAENVGGSYVSGYRCDRGDLGVFCVASEGLRLVEKGRSVVLRCGLGELFFEGEDVVGELVHLCHEDGAADGSL